MGLQYLFNFYSEGHDYTLLQKTSYRIIPSLHRCANKHEYAVTYL